MLITQQSALQLIFEAGKTMKQDVVDILLPELLPEVFHWVQLRGTGWKKDQSDIVRQADLAAVMPSGSIQDEKHVFLSVPAPENLHADTVHIGKDQGVKGPVVRRQGHVGIRKLLDDLDRDQGADGKGCPAPSGIADQPEPGLVLEHEP